MNNTIPDIDLCQYNKIKELMLEKQCLIVLIGITGSGRAIVAENIKSMLPDKVEIVAADKVREQVFGTKKIQESPGRIFSLAHAQCREHFKNDKTVVFDATNIRSKDRIHLIKCGVPRDMRDKVCIIGVDIQVPLEIALFRNRNSGGYVTDKVITSMFNRKTVPSNGDKYFDHIFQIKNFEIDDVNALMNN